MKYFKHSGGAKYREYLKGREVALSFITAASFALSGVGVFVYYYFHLFGSATGTGVGYVGITVIFLFFAFLLWLKKRGNIFFVAYSLVIFYSLVMVFLVANSGFDVPLGVLLGALVVCLINVLLPSKVGGLWSSVIILIYSVIAALELYGVISPRRDWQTKLNFGDAITYAGTLALIIVIAWLFNREIEKAFRRALNSEAELVKERDQLEIRVDERTEQLKRVQFEQVLQVHRFADIGRHASGLLHDMVNPLTGLMLHVEELYAKSKDAKGVELKTVAESAKEALEATRRLEQFVTAARKQIRQEEVSSDFSPAEEIKHVVSGLAYRSRFLKVRVECEVDAKLVLRGSAVKFYKVLQNLLSNAIDSYENVPGEGDKRLVTVTFYREKSNFVLKVSDAGAGIELKDQQKIFQPFYTTKSDDKGTGIGLTITRDIIKNDFKGEISLVSAPGSGTAVTVELPAEGFLKGAG